MKLIESTCGKKVWALDNQIEAIETLKNCRKGGCATIKGYVPTSGYVSSPTVNISAITRFSTQRLYERRLEQLNTITFNDAKKVIDDGDDEVLKQLSEKELQKIFASRMAMETNSLVKSLDGDRSDNYRQAHDRCYAQFGEGIKVHLKTEKVNGQAEPVLIDGHPVINSIMVSIIELSRKTIVEGEYKVVNSGAPVRMGNIIKKLLNSRSHSMKTLSLKQDNFESFHIDRNEMLAEDMQSLGDIIA